MVTLTCPSCHLSYNSTPGTPCPRCGHPAPPVPMPAAPQKTVTRRPKKAKQPERRGRKALIWSFVALLFAGVLAGEYFLTAGIYRTATYKECLELWNSGTPIGNNRRAPDPVYRVIEPEAPADTLIDRLIDESELGTDSIDLPAAAPHHSPEDIDSLFT